MIKEELCKAVAQTLIETGVEGGFDSVSCSTAFDGLCIGCSQWEGPRADNLLSYIDGGEKFMGRTYSGVLANGEIEELEALLDSEQGQTAQMIILASDCEGYIESVENQGLFDDKAIIYAASWCPTSIYCVCQCILKANIAGVRINDVEELAWYFRNNYARIADCEEYADGYANRSDIALEYVLTNY